MSPITPDRLLELIRGGESLDVEFKGESGQPFSDANLVESVVCLANRTGTAPGWLLVGVEDDRSITGARPRHEAGKTDVARIRLLIANRTRPSQTVRAEVFQVDEGNILAIEVPTSRQPVGTADGRYVRRTIGGDGKPACVPFHFHEIHSRQADLGLLDYSALPVPELGWDDLEPIELSRFRRSIRENASRSDQALLGLSDLDLAKALGAVETAGERVTVRVLGLLLFGKTSTLTAALPLHEVAFQRLARSDVEVNDFFRWPLLRIMEEMETRLRAYTREREILVGMVRIGIPDYPPRAYREGVANALIHRDYTRLGAVHVQWHHDRLQISSPGGFPEGVHLGNVLVTDPRPRNPLLADAFKRAGIVERTARGIDTIFHQQLRSGRPAPTYERSTAAGVTLVLPGGEVNTEFVRLLVEEEREGGPLDLQDLLLLDHLWLERRMTTQEAMIAIQLGHDTTGRHLHGLAERGLIDARGSGKERSYRLSLATYRRLGVESEYPRRRGFDPTVQEQMVMEYVRSHGRITRRETKELCKIKSAQATRLLRRLVDKGELSMHGQKRGAWYSSRIQPMIHSYDNDP